MRLLISGKLAISMVESLAKERLKVSESSEGVWSAQRETIQVIRCALRVHSRSIHTARLLPFPCLSASSPPGPILLLRDLRPANEPPTSMVALSFRDSSVCTPMDFLTRRVAGKVASPGADMLVMMLVLPRSSEARSSNLVIKTTPMTDRVCLLSRGSNGTYQMHTSSPC